MIRNNNSGIKLKSALEYHEVGWSTIPLVPRKKCPFKDFPLERYFQERPSEADLREWFQDDRADIGVCLGEISDGLCLRDIDDMPFYDAWVKNHPGLASSLPVVATGRDGGGRHVYFTADINDIREHSRTGNGRILSLPDGGHLKAHGIGVLPPSTHHSGRQYQWLVPPDDVPFVSDLLAAGLLPPELAFRGFTQDILSLSESSASSASSSKMALMRPQPAAGETEVEWAVRTSLPTEAGQRHTRLFEFTRRLQAIPQFQNADPRELLSQVTYWHNVAKPHIRTKDFQETWLDFLESWDKVSNPFGTRFEIAAQRAQGKGIDLIESLCKELQDLWGDKPFFLSARVAGTQAGVSAVTASKWIRKLIRQGKLKSVEKGAYRGRQASTYCYLG